MRMNIQMTGIDYTKATVGQREKFALTKPVEINMLRFIGRTYAVPGCVIISTCNRMELWVNGPDDRSVRLGDVIRELFDLDEEEYRGLFTERDGATAISHLFELSCGMKSLVFGEDQILSQVKEALLTARECGAADPVLETLFRHAVTAAKKVKTQVRLVAVDRSAAQTAVALAKELLGTLKGQKCLVIGSGEMGRQAAGGLINEGCEVVMTLRQYKTGETVVPSGCRTIDYEDRYAAFEKAGIVISATRSPHYTLRYDKVRSAAGNGKKIILDLALPRDVDPEIAALTNIALYDIDHFRDSAAPEPDGENTAKVREIIGEAMGEFTRWYGTRDLIPKISEISAKASLDVESRIRHQLRKTALDENGREEICRLAVSAVEKVVRKTMLELNDCNEGCNGPIGFIENPDGADCGETAAASRLPLRFPLYVDLTGKEIAVIGGGDIARRRIVSLASFPCSVTVVALRAHEALVRLGAEKKLSLKIKSYESRDIENAFLVIAATDDRELNHRIALDALTNGQFCSVADCREECTFYFPATVPFKGGVIGICGTGEDHTGTKRMAEEIREFIKEKEKQ